MITPTSVKISMNARVNPAIRSSSLHILRTKTFQASISVLPYRIWGFRGGPEPAPISIYRLLGRSVLHEIEAELEGIFARQALCFHVAHIRGQDGFHSFPHLRFVLGACLGEFVAFLYRPLTGFIIDLAPRSRVLFKPFFVQLLHD